MLGGCTTSVFHTGSLGRVALRRVTPPQPAALMPAEGALLVDNGVLTGALCGPASAQKLSLLQRSVIQLLAATSFLLMGS